MCHIYQPSLDLAIDHKCEKFVQAHLEASPLGERKEYARRETDLSEKEVARGVGALNTGD